MTYYVSAIASWQDGKPVFQTVSELDGMIIAWDSDDFASLLAVAQSGFPVFVADEVNDLPKIARAVKQMGPRMCLIEKGFFADNFANDRTIKTIGG